MQLLAGQALLAVLQLQAVQVLPDLHRKIGSTMMADAIDGAGSKSVQ
jgi:hypothetical protein